MVSSASMGVSAASDMVSSASAGMGKKMTNMKSSLKDKVEGTLGRLSLVAVSEVDKSEETEENEGTSVVMDKAPQDSIRSEKRLSEVKDVKAQLITAKLKARIDGTDNDGVLGLVQSSDYCPDALPNAQDYCPVNIQRQCSLRDTSKFMKYNMSNMNDNKRAEEGEEEEAKTMDVQDTSYVRKPCLRRMLVEYEALCNHPKYHLKQILLSRRFHLYAHRFGNAQYQRTLVYPTLTQPDELYSCPWLKRQAVCGECKDEERPTNEKERTRMNGHRFIIAADTQFGILMDGFAMAPPNWSSEIEISRKCVKQINLMTGKERPLYVCVCGDLVDTESSFSGAIASWKKVMTGWERNLVFEQQVRDFKRVWAGLDQDIALVCLCGNHDVGNKPTRESIDHWTSQFGDDFLSFWVNGSFNICLNNCLFSNPTGAPDLFKEQVQWLEERLIYGRENDASHIFVYGHFPWFLKHEEETDEELASFSAAPEGWGPPGSSFADSYFTIPLEQRKIAMALFKKYDVTACFSGHFHQNVVTQTSWGMPMIVTGPLSMNLHSEIGPELSNGETNGIGMRIVDVGDAGKMSHKWVLLDDEQEIYEHAQERCMKQAALEGELQETPTTRNSLLDKLGV